MRDSGQREEKELLLNDRWFNIVVDPALDEEGNLAGGVHVMSDITERMEAEEAIRITQEALGQERDLLNSLLDNIPDQIWIKDTNSKFVRTNKATALWFGLSDPDQVVGKGGFDFFTEEFARQEYEGEQELIRSGKTVVGKEAKETWPDREDTWVSTTKVPLCNPEGDIIGIIGISRDVTEHKKLEEQFRQSQKMEAVGRLAGGVAHDFNNMMTVVIGYSEFLLSKLKKEDAEYKSVEGIMNAGKRAASLTQQLLAFSRKQVFQPHVVNLNALVTDLEKMLKRLIGEDIDLQLDLDSKLGAVRADPSQIDQIIMNLAVNARDAMPRGGKIAIETANVELDEEYARLHMEVQPGPYVMLAVSDTGSGMDKETQSRIFEPFFSTKEEGKGTGLGLSTVYGIVKQSGGNIWVYTEPGQGTTFKIYFPRIEEAAEARKQEEASDKSFRGSETILLVEDEEMVRDLAYKVLAEMGYKVLAASNGEEALQICEQHKEPIHLMLTDVVMPKMSGRELAEGSVRWYPELKVIYMSGYTDSSVIRNGMLEPGVNFVQKPFTPLSLTKKVREVLDASESQKG
jgi:PAS domain S-box-containing protein